MESREKRRHRSIDSEACENARLGVQINDAFLTFGVSSLR
jgi:hypothetical protein